MLLQVLLRRWPLHYIRKFFEKFAVRVRIRQSALKDSALGFTPLTTGFTWLLRGHFGHEPELMTLFSEIPYTTEREQWEEVDLSGETDLELYSASGNNNGSISDPWSF